ncbi:toxin-antitoxin system YwqK [Faustovirus]|nr:toxin-antitoxin system YwqK [Faustovirus]QJX73707.1 toxin-antitoxin system YwqK [Faustovirus]
MQYPIIPIELFCNHIIWDNFGAINPLMRSCKLLYANIKAQYDKIIDIYTSVKETICDDGRVIEFHVLPNGVKHGKYTIFDKWDHVIEECTCINDKFEGQYTVIINKRNKHFITYNYENGLRNGACIESRNGIVIEQSHYLMDKLHGPYVCYYEGAPNADGTLPVLSSMKYNNGNLDGDAISYFENGQKNSLRQYNNGEFNGKHYVKNIAGEYKEFFIYKNGIIVDFKTCTFNKGVDAQGDDIIITITPIQRGEQLVLVKTNQYDAKLEEWSIDKYGNLQGKYTEWFDNGVVSRERMYTDDKLDGAYRMYNNTGTLLFEVMYVNGKREGNEIDYHDNGQIWQIIPYVHNKREGVKQVFNEHGRLVEVKTYKNNYKNGIAVRYRANGTKRSQRHYYKNRLHGLSTRYNIHNAPVQSTEYFMGVKIKGSFTPS